MINLQPMMDYLMELQKHNHKEWFQSHKQERLEAVAIFESFLQECILSIQTFDEMIPDLEPKNLTFKLIRDTRFSCDKTPYLPAFRAHIGPKGKLPIPVGYYIHIQPDGNSFIGGGLFADMFKDATEMMRFHLQDNGKQFYDIVHDQDFVQSFTLLGTKLKNVPKNYDGNHPYAEYLKYKSWFIEKHFDDALILDERFAHEVVTLCRMMKPFNDYLNQAFMNFKMPER